MTKVYDRNGRRIIAALWDEISQKPDRINEIAVLVDPNKLQYVGWNDVANELQLLDFDAADIPYDNSGSGAVATEVQAALDELFAASGASTVFAGFVDGAAVAEQLPSGWTVARTAVGTYTLTHGLSLAGADDLSLVVTSENSRAEYFSPGTNSIGVRIQVTPDVDVDRDWFFLAKRNL